MMFGIFTFKRNRCLNCDKKLPRGWKKLFCEACEPQVTEVGSPVTEEVLTPDEYLPEELQENTVFHMDEGKIAYTVPWAMFADPSRHLFIVGTYPVFEEPGGTIQLRITKKNGEILVDKSSIGDYRYSPGEPCYVGVSRSDYIPIKLVKQI